MSTALVATRDVRMYTSKRVCDNYRVHIVQLFNLRAFLHNICPVYTNVGKDDIRC